MNSAMQADSNDTCAILIANLFIFSILQMPSDDCRQGLRDFIDLAR
jgi:hypothetical protein